MRDLNPICRDARERLLECRGVLPIGIAELPGGDAKHTGDAELGGGAGSAARDAGLAAHLETCAECAAFAQRVARFSALLGSLPRRNSPPELDGAVVAALEAGHRQERAIAAVRGLARLPMPAEIPAEPSVDLPTDPWGRVLEGQRPGARAPAVLDRLVDEDLRGASAALARRFTSRLERHRAPSVLRERLQRSALSLFRPRASRRNLLAAAALVLLLAGGGLWLRQRSARDVDQDLGFEIRYETRLDAMDPIARSLVGGLSGGIVDLGPRGDRR
jgi:hypothetical protein